VNLSPVIPALALYLGVTRAEVGLLGTVFFWVYAIGNIINGEIGSRIVPRKMIALGLLLIVLTNIGFAFQTSLVVMLILWAINGWAQSMGWSPMLRIIAEQFDTEQVKRISTIMPFSYVIGTATTWIIIGFLASGSTWRIAFWLPGIVVAVMLIVWWFSGIDVPQREAKPVQWREIMVEVGTIRYVLVAGALSGAVYIGSIIWLPTYISDTGLVPENIVGFTAAILQVIALPGLFLARHQVNQTGNVFQPAIRFLLATGAGFALAAVASDLLALTLITIALLMLNGAVGLIVSTIPLVLSPDGRASSVTGVVNALVNFGGGVSGFFVGLLLDQGSWAIVFSLWAACAFIAAILIRFNNAQQNIYATN